MQTTLQRVPHPSLPAESGRQGANGRSAPIAAAISPLARAGCARQGRPRAVLARPTSGVVRPHARTGAAVLLAGRTVSGAAGEAGPICSACDAATCCSVDKGRCPADEQSQRLVVRTLLTRGQRLWVDRAEYRTAARIDHCYHHLRTTRCVEHDPIESGAGAGDAHEVTYRGGLHHPSLPSARRPPLVSRRRPRCSTCLGVYPLL
jgi:hypothetical protein